MNTIRLKYAGGLLDRSSSLRKNKEWLKQQLSNPQTVIIPVWKNNNLIKDFKDQNTNTTFARFTLENFPWLVGTDNTPVFLGLENKTAIFTADISHMNENELSSFHQYGEFMDLRRSGPFLSKEDAAILGFARGMINWHQNHLFCSRCGSKTENLEGGHLRLCTNSECSRESYPRTDPAVIMLVESKEPGQPAKCLLGRQKSWPKGVYSTLAGFVEPGESLEDAVFREVFEESGIIIENINYIASQPWPFPASIMLGFFAEAKSTELKIDNDELEEAHWFSADQLKTAGEWNDETANFRLSRKDSISRFLIDTWIEKQTNNK